MHSRLSLGPFRRPRRFLGSLLPEWNFLTIHVCMPLMLRKRYRNNGEHDLCKLQYNTIKYIWFMFELIRGVVCLFYHYVSFLRCYFLGICDSFSQRQLHRLPLPLRKRHDSRVSCRREPLSKLNWQADLCAEA